MSTSIYNSKDPWASGGRTGYTPPPVPLRARPKTPSFDVARLLRTALVFVGLIWAFNYAWRNYILGN